MKRILLRVSVMVSMLLILSDCEVAGPVPNIDYEFPSGGIDVEDVTLEDVVPSDITPGGMTSAGQTAFGNNLSSVNTSATAAAAVQGQVATLGTALSAAQESDLEALDVNSLVTQIQSGVGDPNSSIISLISTSQGLIAGFPQLASLVPAITLPSSGGRVLNEGGREAVISVPLIETGVNAVNNLVLDCEAAARLAFDTTVKEIEADYDGQVVEVDTKDAGNSAAALEVSSLGIASANARYAERSLFFKGQYDAFEAFIASATVFSTDEIRLLRVLNTLVYAINIYNSTLLLNFEEVAISDQLALNLEQVALAKERMLEDASAKRNAAVQEATDRLNEGLETCHNQGGASGSD